MKWFNPATWFGRKKNEKDKKELVPTSPPNPLYYSDPLLPMMGHTASVPIPKSPEPPQKDPDEIAFEMVRNKLREYYFDKALQMAGPNDTFCFHCLDKTERSAEYAEYIYVYALKQSKEGHFDFCLGFVGPATNLAAPKPWSGMSSKEFRHNQNIVIVLRIDKPFQPNLSAEELLEKATGIDDFTHMWQDVSRLAMD